MTTSRITYGQLERLLCRWGFRQELSTPATVFQHTSSDAMVVLPMHDPHDPVRAIDLASIRKLLDERGIVERDAFDRQTHALRSS